MSSTDGSVSSARYSGACSDVCETREEKREGWAELVRVLMRVGREGCQGCQVFSPLKVVIEPFNYKSGPCQSEVKLRLNCIL